MCLLRIFDPIDGGRRGKDTGGTDPARFATSSFQVASQFIGLVVIESAVPLQILFQPCPGAVQADFHGSKRYSRHVSDFPVRKLRQFAEHEHRPVRLRECFSSIPGTCLSLLPYATRRAREKKI